MKGNKRVDVNLDDSIFTAILDDRSQKSVTRNFSLNSYDRKLVAAGGWPAYADAKY